MLQAAFTVGCEAKGIEISDDRNNVANAIKHSLQDIYYVLFGNNKIVSQSLGLKVHSFLEMPVIFANVRMFAPLKSFSHFAQGK